MSGRMLYRYEYFNMGVLRGDGRGSEGEGGRGDIPQISCFLTASNWCSTIWVIRKTVNLKVKCAAAIAATYFYTEIEVAMKHIYYKGEKGVAPSNELQWYREGG